jgi:hypothetical protein
MTWTPHSENNSHHIVLKYFRFIDQKDMHSLLNLFTDDCIIYEPFSRWQSSYDNDGIGKTRLKGRSEIESFLNVVMMASDGLQHEIEFIDDSINDNEQMYDIVTSTSTSIVSALATFYTSQGGDKLKERLTFHIIFKVNGDTIDITSRDNNYGTNKKIKTLWIQFCAPESFAR